MATVVLMVCAVDDWPLNDTEVVESPRTPILVATPLTLYQALPDAPVCTTQQTISAMNE